MARMYKKQARNAIKNLIFPNDTGLAYRVVWPGLRYSEAPVRCLRRGASPGLRSTSAPATQPSIETWHQLQGRRQVTPAKRPERQRIANDSHRGQDADPQPAGAVLIPVGVEDHRLRLIVMEDGEGTQRPGGVP
jgi:hypothetical protein